LRIPRIFRTFASLLPSSNVSATTFSVLGPCETTVAGCRSAGGGMQPSGPGVGSGDGGGSVGAGVAVGITVTAPVGEAPGAGDEVAITLESAGGVQPAATADTATTTPAMAATARNTRVRRLRLGSRITR